LFQIEIKSVGRKIMKNRIYIILCMVMMLGGHVPVQNASQQSQSGPSWVSAAFAGAGLGFFLGSWLMYRSFHKKVRTVTTNLTDLRTTVGNNRRELTDTVTTNLAHAAQLTDNYFEVNNTGMQQIVARLNAHTARMDTFHHRVTEHINAQARQSYRFNTMVTDGFIGHSVLLAYLMSRPQITINIAVVRQNNNPPIPLD
jgi:hypothetical protein